MNNTGKKDSNEVLIPVRKSSGDWAEWVFDHKEGLLITIIVILLLAIVFVSYQITVGGKKKAQSIIIFDFEQEFVQPDQRVHRIASNFDFGDVQNRVSNEYASEGGGSSRRRAGNDATQDIYNEADQIMGQADANREAYEKGLADIEEGTRLARAGGGRGGRGGTSGSSGNNSSGENNSTSGSGNGKGEGDTKVKGTVTVSFSLVNPLRTSVKLHIPAYRCQGGGQVVVNIGVNRSGYVTSASIDKSNSDSDNCLTEMALEAARKSRFNTDSSAPDPHRGTITYIFIPQ